MVGRLEESNCRVVFSHDSCKIPAKVKSEQLIVHNKYVMHPAFSYLSSLHGWTKPTK